MNIIKVTGIVFSPTDSTAAVVDWLSYAIAAELDVDADRENMTVRNEIGDNKEFSSRELVVFGVPSYGGRVPALAVERFRQIRGSGTPAVLVVTYGNRAYDDTFLELKEVVSSQRFCCVAAVAAVTEHSIMHQYGKGRPSEDDRTELAGFGKRICSRLRELPKGFGGDLLVPGAFPYREYKGVPLKPKADKNCNECGLCAVECTAGAIHKETPKQTDESVCISCMRCIKVCPKGARKLNPVLLAGASLTLKKACEEAKRNELVI